MTDDELAELREVYGGAATCGVFVLREQGDPVCGRCGWSHEAHVEVPRLLEHIAELERRLSNGDDCVSASG